MSPLDLATANTAASALSKGLSYVSGTSIRPLLGMTIGAAFDRSVAQWGDRSALVVRHQNIHWSYDELAEQVDLLAAGLLSYGLRPGDRVGIWSPNRAEWVVAQFATAKAGLILVNINPAYRPVELQYVLRKVGCRALITATAFKSSDYLGMLTSIAPEFPDGTPGDLHLKALPELRAVFQLGGPIHRGAIAYDAVLQRGTAEQRRLLADVSRNLQFDDAINIQFTSGTTGSPKGATLTHHNLLNNGLFAGELMGFTSDDKLCIPVPFYHCFGMVLANLACVTHGASMIVPGESFDARSVLEAIELERCTALHGVPTMFISVLQHPDFGRRDISTLRTGIMAGSPCPIEVMRRVIGEMGMHEITIGYGMTETSPLSFQSRPDDTIERRVSTVGRIHPHVEVKIVDKQSRIVPHGVAGELCTRGYSVMKGYWDETLKTTEAIDDDGWMHTGDLATLDEEGYCNIVGRIKDMVIRGGENIYPREIEEFLYGHPAVQDVQVFGVPDDKYGEELCAWIQLRPGTTADEAAIRDYCQGRIAHYKVPHYVRFVDAFPMTVTGKIQKFVMRQAMSEVLGVREQKTA
ncbi:MAG TPA: AMP-binding protein [Acetobacteraceae bacterium]|jgi:fatty-acyl-CoA synthase|nr:AMP-binding protein [Acetobacteraceae bacterium]